MKNIFTIHSHITFLSALAVSKYLQLEKSSIIFLTSNYKIRINGYTVYPSYDQYESSLTLVEKIKNFNYPQAYDRYIEKITGGEEYEAYIDLMSSGNRVLITNPKCKAYHFLEEGIVNYGDYDSLRILTIDNDRFPWRIDYRKDWKVLVNGVVRVLRGRSVKLLSLPIHPSVYAFVRGVKFYCFSEKAFVHIPDDKKVVVPFQLIADEMFSLTNGIDISDEYLWLGDAIVSFYKIDLAEFEEGLNNFLSAIQHKTDYRIKKAHIKFRPAQSEEEKQITLKTFHSFDIVTVILPENTVIEALLIVSKNVTVMGVGTSLLIYGSILGHQSYTMFRLLSNKYNIPLATDYPGFWRMVEKL